MNSNGSVTTIANLSAYQRANPVAHPEPDDFEPDGTWYSIIAIRGSLYTVEPNHGEIVKVTTGGQISRVIDVSASQGHVVPTAIAYHGNFYIGNLGVFPQDAGSSKVWKVTPSGRIKLDTGGFNLVLGLAFDGRDRMYVLEASAAPAPTPGTGRIVRVDSNGKSRVVIADGLFFPTGMTQTYTRLRPWAKRTRTIVGGAIILAFSASQGLANDANHRAAKKPSTPFEDARIIIEFNSTDQDVGVQIGRAHV